MGERTEHWQLGKENLRELMGVGFLGVVSGIVLPVGLLTGFSYVSPIGEEHRLRPPATHFYPGPGQQGGPQCPTARRPGWSGQGVQVLGRRSGDLRGATTSTKRRRPGPSRPWKRRGSSPFWDQHGSRRCPSPRQEVQGTELGKGLLPMSVAASQFSVSRRCGPSGQ